MIVNETYPHFWPTEMDSGKNFVVEVTANYDYDSLVRYSASRKALCDPFLDFYCEYDYDFDYESGPTFFPWPSVTEVQVSESDSTVFVHALRHSEEDVTHYLTCTGSTDPSTYLTLSITATDASGYLLLPVVERRLSVIDVTEGSPSSGRLLAGDYIISVNGNAVYSYEDLELHLPALDSATPVTIVVDRFGEDITEVITPALHPDGYFYLGVFIYEEELLYYQYSSVETYSLRESDEGEIVVLSFVVPKGTVPGILSCETGYGTQYSGDGYLFPFTIPPEPLGLISDPVVFGNPSVGSYYDTLELDIGIWQGGDSIGFRYEWFRCDEQVRQASGSLHPSCSQIENEDYAFYLPTEEDLGKYLMAKVTTSLGPNTISRYTASTDSPGCDPFADFACSFSLPEYILSGESGLLAPNSLEFDISGGDSTVEFGAILGDIEWWEAEAGEGAQYYVSVTCLDPNNPENLMFLFSTYLSTSSYVVIDGEEIPVESQVNQDGDNYSVQASFQLPRGTTPTIYSCSSLQGWLPLDQEDLSPVGGFDYPISIF